MGHTTEIFIGTLSFITLGFLVALPLSFTVRSKTADPRQKQDAYRLTWILTLVGTFCFWIMWLSAYMHQMYPLVTPDI